MLEAVDLRAKSLKLILLLASYNVISHHGKKEHKAVELILALLRNCVVMWSIPC